MLGKEADESITSITAAIERLKSKNFSTLREANEELDRIQLFKELKSIDGAKIAFINALVAMDPEHRKFLLSIDLDVLQRLSSISSSEHDILLANVLGARRTLSELKNSNSVLKNLSSMELTEQQVDQLIWVSSKFFEVQNVIVVIYFLAIQI